MRVLKHGKTYCTKICPVCKCEFEYSWGDVQINGTYNGQNSYIHCPECNLCMFLSAYEDGKNVTKEWNESSIEAVERFMGREE